MLVSTKRLVAPLFYPASFHCKLFTFLGKYITSSTQIKEFNGMKIEIGEEREGEKDLFRKWKYELEKI